MQILIHLTYTPKAKLYVENLAICQENMLNYILITMKNYSYSLNEAITEIFDNIVRSIKIKKNNEKEDNDYHGKVYLITDGEEKEGYIDVTKNKKKKYCLKYDDNADIFNAHILYDIFIYI